MSIGTQKKLRIFVLFNTSRKLAISPVYISEKKKKNVMKRRCFTYEVTCPSTSYGENIQGLLDLHVSMGYFTFFVC